MDLKLAVVVVTLVTNVVYGKECKDGFVPWEGNCASVQGTAEQAQLKSTEQWTSKEVPPRQKQPAWERGEVTAMQFPPEAKKKVETSDVGKDPK